jgi:hypothetical protein
MKNRTLLVSGLVLVLLLMQVVGQPTHPQLLTPFTKAETVNKSLTRQAPAPIINETFGTGSSSEHGEKVIECSSGGFALAGTTDGYGASCQDGWLIRTDSDGNHLWNYTYGGGGSDFIYSVIECSDGGFVLVGYTYSFGVSNAACWLVKVNANGIFQWNKTYDSTADDFGHEVIEVSTGGFAIAGYSHISPNQDQLWLVRTDPSGNHLWNQSYGGPYDDAAYSLIEVSSGGFLLTGYTKSYGPGVPSTPSRISTPSNLWVVKTNSTGHLQWHRTYHHPDFGYEYGRVSIECSDGGFAIGGYTVNLVTGDCDFWLIRADSLGAHLWNHTYGYSNGEEILRDIIAYSSGGYALGGWTNNTGNQYDDVWLVYTDGSGTQIWNESYGSSRDDYSVGLADCSLGIAVYGTGQTIAYDFQAWFFVIPDDVAPTWNPAPVDQTVLSGLPFRYDLNATDGQGLAVWTINDTTNFAIDSDGVVTDAVLLAVGTYRLRVTVSDPAGNTLIGTFLVTVVVAPLSPLLLFIGIAVVVIVIVCLLIYFWRRSRESK